MRDSTDYNIKIKLDKILSRELLPLHLVFSPKRKVTTDMINNQSKKVIERIKTCNKGRKELNNKAFTQIKNNDCKRGILQNNMDWLQPKSTYFKYQ